MFAIPGQGKEVPAWSLSITESRMRIPRFHRFIVIVLVFCGASAFAGQATGTLSVSATVVNTCAVLPGGGTLSFAAYDPVNANANAPLTQVGSFQLQCTTGTSAAIRLSQGVNAGAGSTDAAPIRNMANGNNRLQYQLYTTSAYTTVWDNVSGVAQNASGGIQKVAVYGAIPPGQIVSAGSYTDLVVITISY